MAPAQRWRAAVRLLVVAAAATVTAALTLATPGYAAAGPTVTIDRLGHYVTNTVFDTYYDPVGVTYWYTHLTIGWKVNAPNGVCKQTLTEQSYDTVGGEPDPILGDETVTTTIGKSVRGHDYGENWMDYERGAHQFVVRVTDCAGHTTASSIAGTDISYREDTSAAITYSSGWSVSHFTGFSGGTTHYATTPGASATVQVHGAVGLVMEKAANRGSFAVYIDGVKKATVNTHSAATQHKRIVWQALLTGTHTLKVVNLATAGHPRVDVDVVLGTT